MARKLSTATQLKNANAEIAEIKKKLENAESYKKMYQNSAERAEQELEQVHRFLDAVPNPIAREPEQYKTISAMTRLAAWLATNKQGA